MLNIILGFLAFCICIALIQKIWPFLVLAIIGYLLYLFPLEAGITLGILVLLAWFASISANKNKTLILNVINTEGMRDIEQLMDDTKLTKNDILTAIESLSENNEINIIEIDNGLIYQSINYKEVSKTNEIMLD